MRVFSPEGRSCRVSAGVSTRDERLRERPGSPQTVCGGRSLANAALAAWRRVADQRTEHVDSGKRRRQRLLVQLPGHGEVDIDREKAIRAVAGALQQKKQPVHCSSGRAVTALHTRLHASSRPMSRGACAS